MTFSLSTLALIVLIAAAVGVWQASMRAREIANRIAVETCRRRSLQFLDGTVMLSRLRPRLDSHGLRLERTYVFDYAIGGSGRASGFIIMLGEEMQHVGLEAGTSA